MVPIITQWSDFDSVYEAFEINTHKFLVHYIFGH